MKTELWSKVKRGNHKVVTLVGSTSPEWQEQYNKVNRELCLAGYVIISVSMFKTDVEDIEAHRELLESIHLQKIRMSDVVVLIHKDAVGKHTAMEMDYCKEIGKPIVVFTTAEQACKGIEVADKI